MGPITGDWPLDSLCGLWLVLHPYSCAHCPGLCQLRQEKAPGTPSTKTRDVQAASEAQALLGCSSRSPGLLLGPGAQGWEELAQSCHEKGTPLPSLLPALGSHDALLTILGGDSSNRGPLTVHMHSQATAAPQPTPSHAPRTWAWVCPSDIPAATKPVLRRVRWVKRADGG